MQEQIAGAHPGVAVPLGEPEGVAGDQVEAVAFRVGLTDQSARMHGPHLGKSQDRQPGRAKVGQRYHGPEISGVRATDHARRRVPGHLLRPSGEAVRSRQILAAHGHEHRLRAGEIIIIEIAAFLPVSSWRIAPILWDHVG